jgi:hypothetical protein
VLRTPTTARAERRPPTPLLGPRERTHDVAQRSLGDGVRTREILDEEELLLDVGREQDQIQELG